MDISLLQQFKGWLNREKVKINKKIIVFAFFLVASAIFWFLNAMSNNYTDTISYPIEYTNLPKDKVLVGKLPNSLNLRINAKGFKLINYRLSPPMIPIIFDVGSFLLNKLENDNTGRSYILTSTAKEKIQEQLSDDVKILDINPDTLFFQLSVLSSKKVPVNPNIELEFDPQFMLFGDIKCTPDSVIVKGPALLLDNLDSYPTEQYSITNLNGEATRQLRMAEIDGLFLDQKNVTIIIPVEEFTELSFEIPLKVKNVPDSLKVKTSPSIIKVNFTIPFSKFEKVKSSDFAAEIDFKSIDDKTKNLKVRLTKYPHEIHTFNFSPRKVDFIIEKK